MGYVCDYCGKQRAMVYCRSDLASLCLSCDQSVHSANALSKRHSRALLCERCHTQPAYVRCIDEGVSFCQKCDWLLHGDDSSSTSHKKQAINSYSGCPSAAEFSTFWPFIMDLPLRSPDESNYEGDLGSLTIEENGTKNSLVDKDSGEDKSAFWMGSPSIPELLAPQCLEQLRDPPSPNLGAALDSLQKTNFSGNKAPTIYEDDPYADLDMDEVDLNFENYEELFGVTLTNSEKLLENGGIDSLFASQHMSTANSNCQSALGAEGSSIGLINSVQPACSNAASGDSVMSIKTEPNLAFTARQAHSGLSFSRLSGESSGGDYQDCGASSMLLLGEPPWCPSGPDGSLQSASREKAVMRYKEKKKSRKFDKKVRYASRKARADVRQRVKGRFIKAGDAFDYDPLSQTRSF